MPEWTMGDRLRKARELLGLGQHEFAKRIGVSHQTVTNAEKGHGAVRPITLNAWERETGISRKWLEHGDGTPSGGPDGGEEITPITSKADRIAQLAASKTRGRSTAGYPVPAVAA